MRDGAWDSMRASSSAQAVAALLAALPVQGRERMREQLAQSLRLVICQRLSIQAVGHGRLPALEVLLGTPQVANAVRDGKLEQLPKLMAAGRAAGMQLLDDALDQLVHAGSITASEARRVMRKDERHEA